MLKLKCGWELPDELELELDPTPYGARRDDLMSRDGALLVTIMKSTGKHYHIEIYQDVSTGCEYDTETKVVDYLGFLKALDKHSYQPAKALLRSYKLDSFLTTQE